MYRPCKNTNKQNPVHLRMTVVSSVLKWTEKHGWKPKKQHGGSWLSRLPLTGKSEKAGTFSPPCCLVFVGQDRQSWHEVPGPLLTFVKKRGLNDGKARITSFTSIESHTRPAAAGLFSEEAARSRKSGNFTDVQNAYTATSSKGGSYK